MFFCTEKLQINELQMYHQLSAINNQLL